MNKDCPFCKKSIDKSEYECPHCRRILIEKVGNYSSVENLTDENGKSDFIKSVKIYITTYIKIVNNILNKILHFKFNRLSFNLNYLGIIPFIILVIFLMSGRGGNYANKDSSKNNLTDTSENLLRVNYVRLPNGTIISSLLNNSSSLGTLKIENGTDYDAVAKLANPVKVKSVFTVYIQAKSQYTIRNIYDGTYILYFQTGKDWDEEKMKFLYHPNFSKFADYFQYTTIETENYDGIHTRYKTYTITLNPVISGTAKTNNVTENEFAKY